MNKYQEALNHIVNCDRDDGGLSNLSDAYRNDISALRELVDKATPKKPIEYEDKYYGCPNCGNTLLFKWIKYNIELEDKNNGLPYCLNCGQAIDRSE